MRWLDRIIASKDMTFTKLWERVKDRGLVCCSPWGHKASETTQRLESSNNGEEGRGQQGCRRGQSLMRRKSEGWGDSQMARLGAPTWQDGAFLQREDHDHRDGEHQNRTDTTHNGPLPAPLVVCHDDRLRGMPL